MDIFRTGVFLAKVPLPQKSPGIDIDSIVCITVAVVIILFTVVKQVGSYRRNRFCPCCDTKTKIHWRTERSDPTWGRITIAKKRITLRFGRGSAFHAVPVARCPGCGWEIDLGK